MQHQLQRRHALGLAIDGPFSNNRRGRKRRRASGQWIAQLKEARHPILVGVLVLGVITFFAALFA